LWVPNKNLKGNKMTKMHRVAIISLLLLTGAASASICDFGWNFENERVLGKVKKIVTVVEPAFGNYAEFYNEKGQKTKFESYWRNGKLKTKVTLEYNKDGDLFRVSYLEPRAKGMKIVGTAEYAAKGVIKFITYNIKGEKERTLKSEPFEYDEKKRLKSFKVKRDDDLKTREYKFDDKGNCTESVYELLGPKPTESELAGKGGCVESFIEPTGHRRIVRKLGKYHNGAPETSDSYSKGEIYMGIVWEYKFDKAGNWTEKTGKVTTYNWDSKEKDKNPKESKSTTKRTRTITYYPEDKKLN
jgi:hypothetical protein